MNRLRLLGSVALTAADAPIEGRAVQRRRLALLAFLAMSRGETAPRERIAALLWPDADSERARHLVSDSVYRINQALGETAVSASGDELRLDRDVLAVDALDFSDAFRARDWSRCVELYTGDFLDGLSVPDAPEFDRWSENERARLAHDYQKALESLAADAESRGAHATAVDYWRRAAVRDPHSSRVALRLMQALERAGERAAAIKHARIHSELVRQEVGAEPDAEVTAYADELSRHAPTPSRRDLVRANARAMVGERASASEAQASEAQASEGDASEGNAREGIASGENDATAPFANLTASDAFAFDRSAADRSAADRSAADRSAIEHSAVDRSAVEHSAPDRSAPQTPSPGSDVPRLFAAAVTAPPGTPTSRNRRWVWVGGMLALAAAAAMGWRTVRGAGEPSATSALAPRTIAVLPFANQSGDGANDYMSDGITDELISTLGGVPGIRVTSRTSVFALKGTRLDVRDVARRLGVESVLEGSVRRSGDRLRVTAQLVTAADGYQLWSETFDRRASDALEIQQQIAAAIVDRLRGSALPSAAAAASHPADDPVAYDLYLQGRYAWHQRTEAGLRVAVEKFTAAAARAPQYARAFAGLGDAYAVLAFYDYVAPRDAFPRAREAAERAIALDSTLAAPHATLGYVDLYYDWRFERAEEEFRRALALDPTYSMAHQWYGNLLTSRGRFDEAERELRLSQELDPLSLIANAALGWVYLYAGRYDEAERQCRRTLELDERFALAWLWKGVAESERGDLDSAVVTLRHAAELSGEPAIMRAALARAYALAGARDSARSIVDSLERQGSAGYVPRYELAKAQLALGDRDGALASLTRALADRAHSMVFLGIDPQFEPLRRDPRFVALREAVERNP